MTAIPNEVASSVSRVPLSLEAAWIATELARGMPACSARGGLRYAASPPCTRSTPLALPGRCPRSSAGRDDLELGGTDDPGYPDRRVQRAYQGLQPDRQTPRSRRIRLQDARESDGCASVDPDEPDDRRSICR
jgi:hypothetical protein